MRFSSSLYSISLFPCLLKQLIVRSIRVEMILYSLSFFSPDLCPLCWSQRKERKTYVCLLMELPEQGPQDWQRSVFIPIPKKGNAKECSNYHTVAFILHARKVMLKVLQATLQQYMNRELPDVQAGFRKGRGTRDQIANICWITKKARRVPEKHLFLLY